MGVQVITTPTGEEMVVMSRGEYEALLQDAAEAFEDGADAATYAAAMAAQSPEDMLPPEVSAMILDGQGRVRALRKWRSLSVDELAAIANVDPELIAQIELGTRLLDRQLAAQLSSALNVPAGWLAV